ncbi:hypothetical protein DL771_000724 [Monosporascus sp. 5C6A]|nr:hypothetical protein DL771_000724 [Monosporascus sp. 5C6A]
MTPASHPAAEPPATSDSALHTCPSDACVKTAAEVSQKATGDQVANIAGPTEPGDASEDMNSPTTHKQTQNEDKYQYSPLPGSGSIRLLRLMPHEDKNARIQCQLFDYPLRDSSEGTHLYEALSYVWGDDGNRQPILIDNHELKVTSNLHAALLRLRDRLLQRVIWIDAICINQGDANEKGQQVQSMANIYAKASRVIVWLGEAAADSDQAIEDIRTAAEQFSGFLISGTGQQAILTLLQRPWFQRIWVLQEVAAARHVLIKCGFTEIDGYGFCLGLSALKLPYATHANLQALICSVTYLIRGSVSRRRYATSRPGRFSLDIRPLGELMDMYHTRKATEHHDKVYALLGMSSDDPTVAGLSASYEVSWKQLFQQLIHFILCERVSVDTWDGKEIAVIKGKGCILGEVSSVERDTTWEDRQHVGITWKNVPIYFGVEGTSHWTFQTSAKPVRVGDAICLLQGASRPTIIRYEVTMRNLQKAMEVFEKALRRTDLGLTYRNYGRWGEGDIKHLAVLVDMFIKDKDQWTLLCLAAGNGHEAVAKQLLDTGKVDSHTEDLQTALRLAVENGYKAVVRLLSNSGTFDPNANNRGGLTALQIAARNGHEVVVKLLLDSGKVDPNVPKRDGFTPLQLAAKYGHELVVKLLLDNSEVDPNVPYGSTLLESVRNGQEVIVKLLLDNSKVDPNVAPWGGCTALHVAVGNRQEVIVKLLLNSSKVNPNLRDRDEGTPLHLAARNGQEVIVKLLLDSSKVNPNVQARGGCTALHEAVRYGQDAIAKLLLDRDKVNPNGRENFGRVAALELAAEIGRESLVKLFLDSKIDPDHREDQLSALLKAARNGHEAIVKLLLDSGKVDPNDQNGNGFTALHFAAEKGQEAIVKLLLDNSKVDPNIKSYSGITALQLAKRNGHKATVKLLLDSGKVDPSIKNWGGIVALELAARSGHKASTARFYRGYSSSHRIYRHYATGPSQDVAQPRAPSAAATGEPKNKEEPFNVDPVNKKVETAVGDLPLSPVMDPSFWEARQRYQTPKAKPGKAQNSVERQLRANPFAKALATPLRQCSITHQRLPKFFLQDFNLIQHPETGAPWWVPRSLMRHESHVAEYPDEEEISEAIQKEEEAINAEDEVTTTAPEKEVTTMAPENEKEAKASIVADANVGAKGGRPYGPSAYALARKDLFAAFKTEGSGLINAHKKLFGGSSSRYRTFGGRAVWREDMDTYILDLMQREVVDHLLYLSRLCAEQGRYYVVRCYGWDDVQHKHKGALLWFQNETDGETPPGPFATFDTQTRNLQGENNPVTVAVHNMPMLLGDEQAARLKSEARVFGEGSIFMLAGRRTTGLQANLWRLQGYLADYRNIR